MFNSKLLQQNQNKCGSCVVTRTKVLPSAFCVALSRHWKIFDGRAGAHRDVASYEVAVGAIFDKKIIAT
jgi:hypothetical protein